MLQDDDVSFFLALALPPKKLFSIKKKRDKIKNTKQMLPWLFFFILFHAVNIFNFPINYYRVRVEFFSSPKNCGL